ncbi:MAG: cell division protein FtsW [Actinomycetota bacterium]|nr:cell division protein FtsW [Actinomycetota bacterium]
MTATTGDARTRAKVATPPKPGQATVIPLQTGSQAAPLLWRPLASYYLLLASTALLLGFGLVMVWSSSYVASTHVSFAVLQKQVLWVALGAPGLFIASRLPVKAFRFLAYPALRGAGVLLLAVFVPGLGVSVNGARRWLALGGPFTIQPSEFVKLGMVLWGADLLARKHKLQTLDSYRRILIPLVPVSAVVLALIEKQNDLGTLLVVTTIVLSLLWVIGAPVRLFAGIVVTVTAAVTYLAFSHPYRVDRLLNFGHPFKDFHHTGWQAGQGIYALGAGGWWGVGLGQSREKWGYLPEAHTDFIFAIIGEELGLVGTLAVLLLFAVLAYAGIRVAQRSRDTFSRLAASAIVAWLLVQALVNIGAVIGLLPITGIPLPLISAGGSALLPTMFALGVLMSLARREPSAAAAIAARGPNIWRRGIHRMAVFLHLDGRRSARAGRSVKPGARGGR